MMPVFGRLSRGGLSCERQFPAMFESILQIVGDIGRRVGAVAKVDAPFASAICDQHPMRAQFIHDLHDEGRNLLAGHAIGLRRNQRRRQRAGGKEGDLGQGRGRRRHLQTY